MTPTPDPDLAARLAYWRGLEIECEALRANPGWRLEEALGQAYRSGQLITLSDHTAAVQAAVAKAVDDAADKIDGLTSDLESAVEVAFKRGADDWVRLNYPKQYERLRARKGDAL